MLGHRDTKTAYRLGHRDIKNAHNLGHRDTETVDIKNPKLARRRRKKERNKKSRNIKSPTFIGLGYLKMSRKLVLDITKFNLNLS